MLALLHCDRYFPIQKRLIRCIYGTYNIRIPYITCTYTHPYLTLDINSAFQNRSTKFWTADTTSLFTDKDTTDIPYIKKNLCSSRIHINYLLFQHMRLRQNFLKMLAVNCYFLSKLFPSKFHSLTNIMLKYITHIIG